MKSSIPFQTIDWINIPKYEFPGETGTSFCQTVQFEGLRLRIVEFSQGYLADHWCEKGHLVYCLDGECVNELKTGENIPLTDGMSFIVSDDASSHRLRTEYGVKLLIIDGDFLKQK